VWERAKLRLLTLSGKKDCEVLDRCSGEFAKVKPLSERKSYLKSGLHGGKMKEENVAFSSIKGEFTG